MQNPRYLGLTPAQLNWGFFAFLALVVGGVCVWLFVLGGEDQVSKTVDDATDEVRSLSRDLGVDIPGPENDLPPVDTTRPISDVELGQMVPSLADFGPEYAGFTPDAENGVQGMDGVAADDFEEADERADLERFGFVSAFQASFDGSAATAAGPIGLGGEVKLFLTNEGASGYRADNASEPASYARRAPGTFLDVGTFDIDVGADEELGLQATIRVTGDDGTTTDYWLATADFRMGRLVGTVGIGATSPGDAQKERLREQLRTVARTMAERMVLVLVAGAGTATPPGQ